MIISVMFLFNTSAPSRRQLFDECLAANTMGDGTGCDNMTCIIVRFLPALATLSAPLPSEETAHLTGETPATEETATNDTEKTHHAAARDSEDTARSLEDNAKCSEGSTEGDDTSAAPRPEPEGAPPEKRQRTE